MSDAPHGPLVFGVPDEGGGPPPPGPRPCYSGLAGTAPALILPADTWVHVSLTIPLPNRNLFQDTTPGFTGIEVPDSSCDGDYDFSWGCTLTVVAATIATSWIGGMLSLNGSPLVGFPLRPSFDWHDVTFDLGDEPMFGLQGNTLWPMIDGGFNRVALYLFAAGAPATVNVNTANLDCHRLAPPAAP